MTVITKTIFTDNQNNILLQTAIGHVSSIKRSDYRDVRLMFDSGSQRTYVTNELREALHLPSIRTENLIIQTFGNKNSNVERVDVVQMKIKGKNSPNYVYVEAICVPTICAPLKNQKLDMNAKDYKHLVNLNLADKYDGKNNLNIDILVGLDFYYSFIENAIRKGSNGPIVL